MSINLKAVAVSRPLLKDLSDHLRTLQGIPPTPTILATVTDSLSGLLERWLRNTVAHDWPSVIELRKAYTVQAAQDLSGHYIFLLSSRLQAFTEGLIGDDGMLADERERHQERVAFLSTLSHNERLYRDAILNFIPDIAPDDLKWLCNRSARLYQSIDEKHIDNFRVMRCRAPWHQSASMYKRAEEKGCFGSIDREVQNPLTGNVFKIGFNYYSH